ncbi:hypothetical protein K7432_014028 [Basidiobolus ranarum]|uniref:Uncharacterized protein n=1 Tax=Basidiobolus ranarum TaxID=34480 RepID=A0ABR2WI92_9FUNG
MYLKVAIISAFLLASANAAHIKLSMPSDHEFLTSELTYPAGEGFMIREGHEFFTPSKYTKHGKKVGKQWSEMTPETSDQETNLPVTSDSSVAPDAESAEDNDVDYSVDDEGNTDLDTSPEETELRGGRGGRGRGGRGRGRGGRGRGRGRFGRGRGRFGRGRGRFGRGRFGRFGRGRFGRFGRGRFGRFGRYGGYGYDCGC